jgi:hypothetical protein
MELVHARRGRSTKPSLSEDPEVQEKMREIKELCRLIDSQHKDRRMELLSPDAGVHARRGRSTESFISRDPEVQEKMREIKKLCLLIESQHKVRRSRKTELLQDTAPHRSFN